MQTGTYSNWFSPGPPLPEDPGGPLTPERIRVLRRCASLRGDIAMLEVLREIEDARDDARRLQIELDLLRRLANEARWSAITWIGSVGGWPPAWLVEMVEHGRADAIQADRARVLGYSAEGGIETWGTPLVPSQGRRWWTHAQPPRSPDADTYDAARRVLAAAKGGHA